MKLNDELVKKKKEHFEYILKYEVSEYWVE